MYSIEYVKLEIIYCIWNLIAFHSCMLASGVYLVRRARELINFESAIVKLTTPFIHSLFFTVVVDQKLLSHATFLIESPSLIFQIKHVCVSIWKGGIFTSFLNCSVWVCSEREKSQIGLIFFYLKNSETFYVPISGFFLNVHFIMCQQSVHLISKCYVIRTMIGRQQLP